MKVSKIFGCVLGLHLCVIATLLVQPGCRTSQPPTQTYTQERTLRTSVEGASRSSNEALIPATRSDFADSDSGGLDAAFNAGFDEGAYAPAPQGNDDFSEFDDIAPIEPLNAGSTQTVEVAGASSEAYTVKKGDNLWSIAKRYNVSLNELYAANGLNKNSVLRIGQQIQIPTDGGTATVRSVQADTYQPTSFNQGSTSYTVQRGDTLSKIAHQFDTSVRAVKAANGKNSDMIRVGEKLMIPVSGTTPSVSAPASTVSAAPSAVRAAPGGRTHTVQAGDYPAVIARKYGMTTGELLALNGITDPRKLRIGQVLKVSGSGSAANVDSRNETVVAPSAAVIESAPTTTVEPILQPVPVRNETSRAQPVAITIVEADPLIEGEVTEIKTEELFDNAIDVPVIRLEE